MALELHLAGDPIYRQPVAPVGELTDEIKATLAELLKALHDFHALGIAAPMFGIPLAIVLVMLNDQPVAMLNPEILEASTELQEVDEASLPFPGANAVISRPKRITVRYTDASGKSQTRELEGLDAAVVQHEMDYLQGISFIDRVSRLKRDMLMRKVQKNIRNGHVPHVHSEMCNH